MEWNRARSLILAVIVALGCAPRRERLPPGVMAVMETEQTASFVRNFNPLLEAGAVRWPTRRAMYEPMLVFNPLLGDYVPWLATSYRWGEDAAGVRRRLMFELRPGVRWSDGAPFSARDVVITFELLRKHPALDGRGLWQELEAVSAPAPLVIEVVLKRPHAPSLEPIAQQAIVPAHIWGKLPDPVSFANETPVATGPFTRVDFFGAQAYQVGRNPHYWQAGQPAVQALRFRAYPANEQIILALLNDELDWAGAFLPAIERVFEGPDRAHHRHWFPLLDATVFLYANTRRPPLDDRRVRQALSMGIDRTRIAEVAMHGYTRPADATGLSDAYARWRDPAAVAAGRWVAHDPQAAARLFDEAGWRLDPQGVRRGPDGRALTLTLELPAGFSDWIAAGQIAVRGLRRLGVDVSLKAVEYQAWFERLQKGDFTLSMAWSDLSTTPHGLYRSLMSTETVRPLGELAAENWHRFGLPEADRLLRELEATVDRPQSWALVSQLQHLFVAHAPAIPLFPGPLWGEFNTARFEGFPHAGDPYAPLSPYVDDPQPLLVLTRVRPR